MYLAGVTQGGDDCVARSHHARHLHGGDNIKPGRGAHKEALFIKEAKCLKIEHGTINIAVALIITAYVLSPVYTHTLKSSTSSN